jgi:hypothetical protein
MKYWGFESGVGVYRRTPEGEEEEAGGEPDGLRRAAAGSSAAAPVVAGGWVCFLFCFARVRRSRLLSLAGSLFPFPYPKPMN